MKDVLLRAKDDDFEFLIRILSRRWNAIGDKILKRRLDHYRRNPSQITRQALAEQIENESRYAGSSEILYFLRWLFRRDPGVSSNEVLQDVAKYLKVKLKLIGTFESHVRRLACKVAERSFLELNPDEQRKILEGLGLDHGAVTDILAALIGKRTALPILFHSLGRKLVEKLVLDLVMAGISYALGREVAKQLIAQLVTRFPWWSEWLGPIAWGITLSWVGLDLQGPAYRITVPVILYVGFVALRESGEDDAVWREMDDE